MRSPRSTTPFELRSVVEAVLVTSKDFSAVKQKPNLQSDWTSFGATRSKFINEFADETLKKQLAYPD